MAFPVRPSCHTREQTGRTSGRAHSNESIRGGGAARSIFPILAPRGRFRQGSSVKANMVPKQVTVHGGTVSKYTEAHCRLSLRERLFSALRTFRGAKGDYGLVPTREACNLNHASKPTSFKSSIPSNVLCSHRTAAIVHVVAFTKAPEHHMGGCARSSPWR